LRKEVGATALENKNKKAYRKRKLEETGRLVIN